MELNIFRYVHGFHSIYSSSMNFLDNPLYAWILCVCDEVYSCFSSIFHKLFEVSCSKQK